MGLFWFGSNSAGLTLRSFLMMYFDIFDIAIMKLDVVCYDML